MCCGYQRKERCSWQRNAPTARATFANAQTGVGRVATQQATTLKQESASSKMCWVRHRRNARHVLSSEGAEEFLDAYEKAIAIAIEGYAQEDKHYVTIAFGCTGGQHRSVAMSEALTKRLRARGLTVSVSARELDKRSAD